jgi:glycosyltransferase involved in cell wall biosynthesis
MSPRISIILPVFNAAATIERAVASICAQTFADWELLVVDDGSNDGTPDRISAVVASDRRIRLIGRPHEGIVAALNAGLAEAQGALIARMDADDESHPERLAEQVAFLRREENRDIGLVSCLVEFGGDRRAGEGFARHVDWVNSLIAPEAIELNRFVESPFAHPSVMFRRELSEKFGGYRAGEFPEDYELWLRWLQAGVRMAKVPRVLLRWNDSPARLSRQDPRYDPEAFFRMKAEWITHDLKKLATTGATAAARRILIWGAGRPTRKRAAYLELHGVRVSGYVDVDAKKIGRGIGGTGLPVLGPADLPAPAEAFVLGYVSSRGAREFNRNALLARGYVEGRDFLMCA